MLLKLLGYDLKRNVEAFLGVAAMLITASVVVRASFGIDSLIAAIAMSFIIMSAMFLSGSISFLIIFNSYKKSVFGSFGYLTLTLPVKRSTVLLSKTISSCVWFNFMAIITIIAIIFAFTADFGWDLSSLSPAIFVQIAIMVIIANAYAFMVLSIMHMAITISNSSFNGVIINKWVGYGIGFGYFIMQWIVTSLLNNTALREHLYVRAYRPSSSIIFHISFNWLDALTPMAFGLIAYFITLNLLNNRVELK